MNIFKAMLYSEMAKEISSPLRSKFKGRFFHRMIESQHAFLAKCAVKSLRIEPDDKILELNCAGGVGLRCAYWRVAEGSGKVYGIEMNKGLFERAEKFCSLEIHEEKVEIHFGIPSHMPFLDDYFDRVFHCNAFYFWPNLELTVKEIFRVMKPGALMVSSLDLEGMKKLEATGNLRALNLDPLNYMVALESQGFQGVQVKYMTYKNKMYQTVFSTKPKKRPEIILDEKVEEFRNDVLRTLEFEREQQLAKGEKAAKPDLTNESDKKTDA